MKRLHQNIIIALGLALLIITTNSAKSETHSTTPSTESLAKPELEKQAHIQTPRATTCLDLISGCGSIRIGDQSILLHPSQTSRELDGSTTISGTAHWINRNDVSESSSTFAITLPKQMISPGHLSSPESTHVSTERPSITQATAQCSAKRDDLDVQDRVLAQVAEVMMGQESISRRAALFTPTCVD